jgi:hypothetical protein
MKVPISQRPERELLMGELAEMLPMAQRYLLF